MRVISAPQSVLIQDRFETAPVSPRRLGGPGNVEGGGDRVEQSAARRGHRRIDAATHHGFESGKRPLPQFGAKVELRKCRANSGQFIRAARWA